MEKKIGQIGLKKQTDRQIEKKIDEQVRWFALQERDNTRSDQVSKDEITHIGKIARYEETKRQAHIDTERNQRLERR